MNRAKLEKEEKARAGAFQVRMDALHASSAQYEKTAGAKIRLEQQKTEERTMAMVEQKNKADIEAEERKREQRRREILRSTEFNMTLIEGKQKRKDNDRLDAVEQRERLEREVEQQRVAEQAAAQRRRNKQLEIRAALEAQVSAKKNVRRNEFALSETEAHLNKVSG
jgi:hypothetical protein